MPGRTKNMLRWDLFGNAIVPKLETDTRGLRITVILLDGVWHLQCPGLIADEIIETNFAHCAKRIALRKVLQALELRQLEDAKRMEELQADIEEC
jgi:hypothetical protein